MINARGKRDPLTLAAGKLVRAPGAEVGESNGGQRLFDSARDLGLLHSLDARAVAHVLRDRHVREQCVVLEDRIHITVEWREPRHIAAV